MATSLRYYLGQVHKKKTFRESRDQSQFIVHARHKWYTHRNNWKYIMILETRIGIPKSGEN